MLQVNFCQITFCEFVNWRESVLPVLKIHSPTGNLLLWQHSSSLIPWLHNRRLIVLYFFGRSPKRRLLKGKLEIVNRNRTNPNKRLVRRLNSFLEKNTYSSFDAGWKVSINVEQLLWLDVCIFRLKITKNWQILTFSSSDTYKHLF